jgi:uncharacterized membrane protein
LIVYPKARIDALTDGIYSVAMTLLVLDIRLPENFHPKDDQELLHGFAELFPRLWPYVISFVVLGMRWLASLGDRVESGPVSRAYAKWWLLYLLLVTGVPFTTVIMGRYPDHAPAMWLYAGTTLLMALVSLRMVSLVPSTHSEPLLRERRASIGGLIAVSVLAILLSFWNPARAPLAFLLIPVMPLAARLFRGLRSAASG